MDQYDKNGFAFLSLNFAFLKSIAYFYFLENGKKIVLPIRTTGHHTALEMKFISSDVSNA